MVAGNDGPNQRNSTSEHHFPDDARTTRSHAGESIEDRRNWPGIILAAVGIVLVGLTLTAAGYGFAGWAVVAGILGVICLVAGGLIVVAEHRRIKLEEGATLREPRGH
ncbi:hypothetical protein ACWCPQ_24475 [Nocardia sp. NPDC001965]